MSNNTGDTSNDELKLLRASKSQEALATMQKSVEVMRGSKDIMIEYNDIWAQIQGAKFRSLIGAGFSEEQAMEFCVELEDLIG